VTDDDDHDTCVRAWLERNAKDAPPDRLLRAFEDAFTAMWRRAHQTLGDVTLTAIVDRVLYVAAERYPALSSLGVDSSGLRSEALRQRAQSLRGDQLADGVRFVLVEFLVVLGNLTAEILTPALHAELSKLAPEASEPDEDVVP
jgi:hypothetical protein